MKRELTKKVLNLCQTVYILKPDHRAYAATVLELDRGVWEDLENGILTAQRETE